MTILTQGDHDDIQISGGSQRWHLRGGLQNSARRVSRLENRVVFAVNRGHVAPFDEPFILPQVGRSVNASQLLHVTQSVFPPAPRQLKAKARVRGAMSTRTKPGLRQRLRRAERDPLSHQLHPRVFPVSQLVGTLHRNQRHPAELTPDFRGAKEALHQFGQGRPLPAPILLA